MAMILSAFPGAQSTKHSPAFTWAKHSQDIPSFARRYDSQLRCTGLAHPLTRRWPPPTIAKTQAILYCMTSQTSRWSESHAQECQETQPPSYIREDR